MKSSAGTKRSNKSSTRSTPSHATHKRPADATQRGDRDGYKANTHADAPAVQTIQLSPRRRITRALLNGTSVALSEYAGEAESAVSRLVVGGVLRCVCNAFLVHSQESLLECSVCRNWCHPACVGVDHVELRALQRQRNFVCPYCTGAVDATTVRARQGDGSDEGTTSRVYFGVGRQPPAPRQVPLKLREVPDRLPEREVERELAAALGALRAMAERAGYDVLDLPSHTLSEEERTQCLDCCAAAVQEATFSESYPVYCLKEVQTAAHSYVQGTLLRSRASRVVCSLVLSNGMDVYGNLRPTLIQLKSALNRHLLDPACVTETMRQCMVINDVSDFVHVTLSATHVAHRNRGLARLLLTMDLLKWALRGRSRAFLNMAIEKHLVQGGTRVEHVSPVASRKLYHALGFEDVYPRHDPVTKAERWTAREAEMGRVMVNLRLVPQVVRVARQLVAREAEGASARVSRSRDVAARAWTLERDEGAGPATRRALRLGRTDSASATRRGGHSRSGDEDDNDASAKPRRRLSLRCS